MKQGTLIIALVLIVSVPTLLRAESVKKRLQKAQKEDVQSNTQVESPSINSEESANEKVNLSQSHSETCSPDFVVVDGANFYHRCYCETLSDPLAEEVAQSLDLTLKPTGIAQLSGRPDYWQCGVELGWSKVPETEKECTARIERFYRVAGNVNATQAMIDCKK